MERSPHPPRSSLPCWGGLGGWAPGPTQGLSFLCPGGGGSKPLSTEGATLRQALTREPSGDPLNSWR